MRDHILQGRQRGEASWAASWRSCCERDMCPHKDKTHETGASGHKHAPGEQNRPGTGAATAQERPRKNERWREAQQAPGGNWRLGSKRAERAVRSQHERILPGAPFPILQGDAGMQPLEHDFNRDDIAFARDGCATAPSHVFSLAWQLTQSTIVLLSPVISSISFLSSAGLSSTTGAASLGFFLLWSAALLLWFLLR